MKRCLNRRDALLLGLGGGLSGCGFQPVYMAASSKDPKPSAGLAEIEVKAINERPGQILREALLEDLRSEPGTPRRYDLQVNFWIAGNAEGVLDFTQATRIQFVGNANWTLMSRDSKPVKLVEGSDHLIDGVDVFDSQYFAVDLDIEKVQRRMAEAMAQRITLRLAMWFHQHPPAVG
jgi:LPS-assembly lipoprotein